MSEVLSFGAILAIIVILIFITMFAAIFYGCVVLLVTIFEYVRGVICLRGVNNGRSFRKRF